MTETIYLSIVVPMFKAQHSLPTLHRRLVDTLGEVTRWELILVDDASPDDTQRVAKGVAKHDGRVSYYRLETNHGQHYATIYGLRRSLGARIVTMDDDLEHAPEFIPALLEPLDAGFLVTIARFRNKTHSRHRRAGSWLAGRLWRRFYGAGELAISSFKAFDRQGLEKILARRTITTAPFSAHILETLPRDSLVNVEVEHHPRLHGKSNYTRSMLLAEFGKLVQAALKRTLPIA